MIIIHNGSVYFETDFKNPFSYVVNLKDLIYENAFILPLNGTYYHFIDNKEVAVVDKISNIRFDKNPHALYLSFTTDKEIYIVIKDKEEIIKVKLHPGISLMLDDITTTGENIFNNNLKEYKENNYILKDILEDIYSKTCYQNKSQFGYITTIEALFFQDLSLIQSFDSFTSAIKVNILSDLGLISEL